MNKIFVMIFLMFSLSVGGCATTGGQSADEKRQSILKMKNKVLSGALLLLAASLVFGGCAGGISQEDYDAVVAERDAVKAQLASLQSDIDAVQRNSKPCRIILLKPEYMQD